MDECSGVDRWGQWRKRVGHGSGIRTARSKIKSQKQEVEVDEGERGTMIYILLLLYVFYVCVDIGLIGIDQLRGGTGAVDAGYRLATGLQTPSG